MTVTETPITAHGVRLAVVADDGTEMGRARLYVLHNDLHAAPEGYLVDVFVDPAFRGKGIARSLVTDIISAARRMGCYKLVATSRDTRPHVHALYLSLGFINHGKEFRIDL